MDSMVLFWFLLLSTTVACCQISRSRSRDVPQPFDSSNRSSTNLEIEEKIKELRKEMVRFQINSTLNITEVPPSGQPLTEASREMIRLLLDEEEEQSRRQLDDSEDKLVIHPSGNGQPCLQYNGSFCKMFGYELDASLNMSAVVMWIYNLDTRPIWVSVSLTLSSSNEDEYHENRYYELNQAGWNKLQLPKIQVTSSWNDSLLYSAEIIGQNIEDTGDRRPYLVVSKLSPVPVRQRRDVDCNANESCCLRHLRFSFAEIGFNFVVYPLRFDANMCIGKCTLDHSAMNTHYERAMAKVLESNSSLRASLGECWTLCCKPKELQPVRVLFSDSNGTVHDSNITALSIKSCGCS